MASVIGSGCNGKSEDGGEIINVIIRKWWLRDACDTGCDRRRVEVA